MSEANNNTDSADTQISGAPPLDMALIEKIRSEFEADITSIEALDRDFHKAVFDAKQKLRQGIQYLDLLVEENTRLKAMIASKDGVIAAKDEDISTRDAIIALLKAELAKANATVATQKATIERIEVEKGGAV